ncbi:CPBP family intramembrane glutamic endopeptidase [Metabacillus idriensis]|uniref:CPBP family intramembrane glutamic endopeptidase n=1 Tax=Metabacillus idriensis TaxID=324768 RepID=UPI00174AB386|nr:type II CAAX endopeptidase family protein [Metabacillus idriensis]
MLKILILLTGPTFMITLGLLVFQNVPLTFLLFYGWLVLVPAVSLLKNHSKPVWDKFITRESILAGFISGTIFLVLLIGIVSLFSESFFEIPRLQQLLIDWKFTGDNVVSLIFVLLLVNPFLEEFYWREYMHQKFFFKLGSFKTVLITSSFYSLYHLLSLIPMFSWPLNVLAVLPVFFAGILWSCFRIKYVSIFAPVLSHILADLGIMLVYLKFFYV